MTQRIVQRSTITPPRHYSDWLPIALVLILAAIFVLWPAHADTGFQLPSGTLSDCNSHCDPPHAVIKLNVPLDPTLKRYGNAKPDSNVDIDGGDHKTVIAEFIENVCKNNPDYFAAHGLGNATGKNCVATETESNDGYFTQSCGKPGNMLKAESFRLSTGMIDKSCDVGAADLCKACGDGKIQLGEDCAHCPRDHAPGECPNTIGSCDNPTIPPPTNPPPSNACNAPKVCIDPPAACPTCPECPAPPVCPTLPTLIGITQAQLDACAALVRTYPPGTGRYRAMVKPVCADVIYRAESWKAKGTP